MFGLQLPQYVEATRIYKRDCYSLELLRLPIDIPAKVIPATRKKLASPTPRSPEIQLLQINPVI